MSLDYRQAGSSKLTDRAVRYLKDRGVSLAMAKRANARSLTPAETSSLFNSRREALLLPVASDYGIARVFDLPPEKGKFRTPDGQALRIYEPPPPPRGKITPERIRRDATLPLFLIEGPIKALSASEHGLPSIGFNGCWGWQKHRRPVAGLEHYEFVDRLCGPVMDADYDDNHNVGLALLELGDWLAAHRGRVVLKEIPKIAGRSTGIDDFLARKSAQAFTELAAHEWDSDYVWKLREKLCPFNDGGNADRLIYRHGDDIRRHVESGTFFVWRESRWLRQPSDAPDVQERMRETIAALFDQAAREKDEKRRKNLRAWAMKSDSAKGIRDAIAVAKSNEAIRVELSDFDRDPMLLGVCNGTLDLRTGKLLPVAREHYVTKRAGTAFDARAASPRWLTFIERITARDSKRMEFLQRLAGYCLAGGNPERRIFFLYGTGANGKSIYIERLLKLLGDYGVPTMAEVLMASRKEKDSEAPSPFLTALRGSRLVTVSEVDERSRLNESLVKDMTGDDMIATRTHRADPVHFRPDFKILVRGNHKPMVYGDDEAIWDRIALVPFEVRIPAAERDPKLASLLDVELPGILNWALAGCLAWQRSGLAIPDYVRSASQTYRDDMDTFHRWLEERTSTAPLPGKATAYELQPELLNAYKLWCTGVGVQPIGDRRFYAKLDERGFVRKKSNGVRCCIGLRLLAAEELAARNVAARLEMEGGGGKGRKGQKGQTFRLNPLERAPKRLTRNSVPSVPSVPPAKEGRK
jgi:P4 family phage/plasmid primase-like protien